MKRWIAVVAACLIGLATTGFAPRGTKPKPPNVIVILTDDLGYGDLGAYGGKLIPTPHIDALAASGVRFTDAYATAAVCAPSRASLLTGRHQARYGFEFNPVGRDDKTGVPTSEVSIAQVMKSAGYATAMVGKWHTGQASGYHPLDRGFDSFFGFFGGAASYFRDPNESSLQADTGADGVVTRTRFPVIRGRQAIEQGGYLTDVFTDEAISFIHGHRDQPFFLYLAYSAPHTPLQAPKAYTDRFTHIASPHQRLYAAMVASLDDNLGRLRQTLAKEGLERDTVIVFLSDNGCPNYIRGACSNAPLSGYKAFPWEGGVRVPFVVSAPGRIGKGLVSSRPVSTMDILPTAARLAGVRVPNGVEGRDIVSAIRPSGRSVERPLFWRMGPNYAVRDGRWKLLVVNKSETVDDMTNLLGSPTPDGVRADVSPLGQWTLLFDVVQDPGEKNDLASAHPEVVARLSRDFANWDKKNVEPLFTSRRQFRSEVNGRKVQLFN